MTFDLLPQDEPGNPLPDVPPGFTDELMRRIADYRRQQRRRRIAVRLLVTVAVAGAAYLLAMRRIDDVPKYDIVRRHPRLAAPVVKPPPVPQPPAAQDAVKRETPVPRALSHTRPPAPQEAVKHDTATVPPTAPPPEAAVAAGIRPGDRRIFIDGKEVTDPAQLAAILKTMDDCKTRQVHLVRDGRPVTYTVRHTREDNTPCTAAPPPRE